MSPAYKNFIYSADRGFLFAYVPKVACTNWKSLLRYMAGQEDWLNNKRAHDKMNSGLTYLDLSGADMEIVRNPAIAKFTFVRDPYSRTLSAYLNKVDSRLPVQEERPGEDHFRKIARAIDSFRCQALDPQIYPRINFEVFLLWLQEAKSYFCNDEHWQKQSTLLKVPDVQYDFIGRFENLEQDARILLEKMNCNIAFPSQKDVHFSPTDARSKIDIYYNEACYRLVNEIYHDDFLNFGYRQNKTFAPASGAPVQKDQRMSPFSDILTVNETISPSDWMWKGNPDHKKYMSAGWSVGRAIMAATTIVETSPKKILDFGCGHGRVLRWLRALYPDSIIVACDRVRNGVDFCAEEFNAIPMYSNDNFDSLDIGSDYDLIWLGSVYTHLPMHLWVKLTKKLKASLSPNGILSFSVAGPFVARLIIDGERNNNAEISIDDLPGFLRDYQETGFGYARHEGVGDREWGRSVISHARLFDFLHDSGLSVIMLGECLYDSRQDIIAARPR